MPRDRRTAALPCAMEADLLPDNQFYERELQRLVRIIPVGSPAAHRRVQVLATPDCQHLLDTLVGSAADYDYQMAHITYNLSSKLIGIKGKGAVHCVDLSENVLLPPLVPRFTSERMALDAQSGQILRLEVWEDFLIGYARDYGAFVFDMRDHKNPRPVLPYGEYTESDTRVASLFLLPSQDNTYQALVPIYQPATESFDINPVFERPEKLAIAGQREVQEGRIIRITRSDGSILELDLAAYFPG